MATAKGVARKSARKGPARKSAGDEATSAARGNRASIMEDKGKEAIERAGMDEALEGNILGSEPLGPSTEHEDHEGGVTDSLTKKGVRGPIAHIAEGEDPDADEDVDLEAQVVRAPSVRERQLRRGTGQGGYVRPLDAVSALKAANAAEDDQEVVRVVAEAPGFYRNKRRHRGDVFDYVLTDAEEGLLPSWVTAQDGSVESRRKGEVIGAPRSTIIEVHPTGGATVREGARTTTTATGISGRAGGQRSAAGPRAGAASGRKSASRSR